MPLVLRANAVWKSYAAGVAGCSARVWVLRGASLAVQEGECVAILGARGAGTTTLLHCLAGLRRPDAGTIERSIDARFIDGARERDGRSPDAPAQLLMYDEPALVDRSAWSGLALASRPERGAVLLATHELRRVRDVADRVLLLRDGRLVPLDRAAGVRRVAERAVVRAR